MAERIGKQLEAARRAKQLSLDDAVRATKIKAARLQDLENEEFSQFPTLVYARGFLNIYAKYLGVDASEYLEHMASGNAVGTDGYSYLDAGDTEAKDVARRKPPSNLPKLIIGGAIVTVFLVGLLGWWLISWYIGRLSPADEAMLDQLESAEVVGVEPEVAPTPSPTPAPLARADSEPRPPGAAIAAATPPPTPTPTPEPVIMRAIPVNPDDVPEISETEANYEIEIRPVRATQVRVHLYALENQPIYDSALAPDAEPLVYRGARFWITAEDPTAIRVLRNGQEISFMESPLLIE